MLYHHNYLLMGCVYLLVTAQLLKPWNWTLPPSFLVYIGFRVTLAFFPQHHWKSSHQKKCVMQCESVEPPWVCRVPRKYHCASFKFFLKPHSSPGVSRDSIWDIWESWTAVQYFKEKGFGLRLPRFGFWLLLLLLCDLCDVLKFI